jgi:hypothetical protein
METPGNLTAGTEVRCDRLHELIQQQLQELSSPSSDIPPDIA